MKTRLHLNPMSLRVIASLGFVHLASLGVLASFERTTVASVALHPLNKVLFVSHAANGVDQESSLAPCLLAVENWNSTPLRQPLILAQAQKKEIKRIIDGDDEPNQPKTDPVPDKASTSKEKDLSGQMPIARPKVPPAPGGPNPYDSKADAGSIEDILWVFCVAVEDDDFATASDAIGQNTKGIARQIREGQLSEEKMSDIRNAISPVKELTPRKLRGEPLKRSFLNKRGQIITFNTKKEKDVYRISDITVAAPKKLPVNLQNQGRPQQQNNGRTDD